MFLKSCFRGAALAALGVSLVGCDGVRQAEGRTQGDTVYVGVAVGLSAPERYVDVFHGVRMALDELNATRPRGSRPLALRRAPDTASSAVEVAVAFRDDPAVVGVVGHTESDATIDAGPVYADVAGGGRRALVAVSPTANGTLVTRDNPWVFRVCPVGPSTARALARYAIDSLGVRRLAVIYRNDAMGKDFRAAFLDEARRRKVEVIETDPFVEEIPEFEAYGMRIAARGAGAVAIAANPGDVLRARRAITAGGGTPVVLTTNGPPAGIAGDDARDFHGIYYLTPYAADRPPTAEGAAFAEAFARRMGRRPDHWSALGYDAAMLIGRATHAVGPDRAKVREWIAAVGRTREAHPGVTGRIAFDEHGDPVDKQQLVRPAELR